MAPKRDQKRGKGVTRLQWACALAGLVVTLAAAGVLALSAFSSPAPATLHITSETVRRSTQGWVVDVLVSNRGDLTAAAVDIEGQVGDQRASTSLDYVPGRGETRASLVFSGEERPEPTLRVLGWSEP